ncbi:MAG: YbjN domain-containing protein [Acidimicrobiales bacterium]|nr:YbjN domain-containing protein [Acidimicrobiales bacterium]
MADPASTQADQAQSMSGTHPPETVAATRQKVDGYLRQFFDGVEVGDGMWSLRYGSCVVNVRVDVFDEDSSVVHIESPVVTGASPSPELFKYVATSADDHEFGHLGVREEHDGTATITFGHSLLGEFLDPAELRTAVVAVSFTADELDDMLAAQFGGKVHDAAGNRPA